MLGPEWDKSLNINGSMWVSDVYHLRHMCPASWMADRSSQHQCLVHCFIKHAAVHTSDSNSVPLCGHSILHSPIIWGEDVACGADSPSDASRNLCVPGHASHVMDLVQQSDPGTLNDPLPGQMVLPALHFLMSSD